jgi:RsiW-degrading membrane proteinase PrsW (M82 family)
MVRRVIFSALAAGFGAGLAFYSKHKHLWVVVIVFLIGAVIGGLFRVSAIRIEKNNVKLYNLLGNIFWLLIFVGCLINFIESFK